MQSDALRAAARVFCCGAGECQHPDACDAPRFDLYARLAAAAFLERVEVSGKMYDAYVMASPKPDEGGNFPKCSRRQKCKNRFRAMLAQLRREI